MTTRFRLLTLGAVYHHLRNGLGDDGASRVSIDFERTSTTSSGTSEANGGGLHVRRGFRAQLDYRGDDLCRAELASMGMSPRPLANVSIVLENERYLYSVDGSRFGFLVDTPVLFDVMSFESRLDVVAIRDATIGQSRAADGTTRHRLSVDVDPQAFRRLLEMFDADIESSREDLDPGYLVVIEAGREVTVRYSWSLTATELVVGATGLPEQYTSRSRCGLTVGVEPLGELGGDPVLIDPTMPTLGGVDDIWVLARRIPVERMTGSGSA